ncbi:MAG: hypothetical protein U0163_21350 [Gemmatimonadaceae bacterium]
MRILIVNLLLLAFTNSPAYAEEAKKVNLLSPEGGVMFWTLIIFVALFAGALEVCVQAEAAAVEAREAALQDAIDKAARDVMRRLACSPSTRRSWTRPAAKPNGSLPTAGRLPRRCAARCSRARGRSKRSCSNAPSVTSSPRRRARLTELRREAIDLAIAGAGKVIEKNLDDAGNRKLVETYLSSLPALKGGAGH